jgi:drug/metabolite transporter superfamily protein YnfA
MDTKSDNEFERVASEIPRKGLAGDFWALLRQNKKWWLLPILIMLLLFGVLIFVSSTALAPFIYTLF